MIRGTENPFAFTTLFNTSKHFKKRFPAGAAIALFALLFLLGFGASASLAGVGTVDAVYTFGASDFFVDPLQPYVYATSGSTLEVINSSTLAVERSIPLPTNSYGMTMSEDGSKLYIAGGSAQSIFVLDTHTWTFLPNLPASGSPWDLAMGLSNRLFVLGSGVYGIYQIDATTGASAGPNAPVFYPYSGALRISADRKRLYYADFGLSPGSLTQMDVSTTNIMIIWSNPGDIGENGEQLALSPDGSMVAYVCGYGYHGYQIPNFRTSDMSLLGVFPTGAYPDCLAYSPDTKYAYALHTIYPTAVDIYDLSTYGRVGQFAVVDEASVMTADQTGQHLFIAFNGEFYGHNEVRVYDTGRSVSVSNLPPVCRIGGPYTAECHGAATVVQLDGSASSDPQGKPLTFLWSADCPGTTFDNPTNATPKLTLNADAAEACTVTLVVSDGQLTNSAHATINVVDTTPPVFTVASNKVVQCGSTWDFDLPKAVDACCGSNVTIRVLATVTNIAMSNSVLESSTRIWQATDCSGNSSQCSQTVTFVDTTPPVLFGASNKVVQCGSSWDFDAPTALDACCGSNVTITILGTTTNSSVPNAFEALTRTWVATDCSGNTNTCSQTVTVVDTQPPVLTQAAATPSTLWPPDHKMVAVTITGVATDSCDPAPTWRISSVTSSDPAPASGADYQITGAHTLFLRAERNDPHTGRTYQITLQVADASGNTATQNVVVTVGQ